MKNTIYIGKLTVLLCLLFFSSCKKTGCTDIDADNYDSLAEKSGTCYFRYGNKVSVSVPSNVDYDPLDAPDLYIKFAKRASPQWDYSSFSTPVNNSYSITVTFQNEFKFTNEIWDYEVYDFDSFDPDDLICSGSFNPLEDGYDGMIELLNDGCVIKFPYSRK